MSRIKIKPSSISGFRIQAWYEIIKITTESSKKQESTKSKEQQESKLTESKSKSQTKSKP
jgi:hypothetical protein